MLVFLSAIAPIEDKSDRAFMEEVYINHRRLMYYTAYKRLGNYTDAQDAVQDAIVRLIDKIPTLRQLDCCTLQRYVVVTVDRVSINLGKKRRRIESRTAELSDNVINSIADDDIPPDEKAIENITFEQLIQLINKLPDKYRNVIKWKLYENWSDEEIALALNINKDSVRTYLSRAKRKLRKLMEEEDNDKR